MHLLKPTRRHALLLAAFGAAGAIFPAPAPSPYPDQPIRFLVPFPPGGADRHARAIVPKAALILGVPIAIDNKPGAGGNIGAAEVARAAPDGCSLLHGTRGVTAHLVGVRCAQFTGTDLQHIENS